MGEDTPARRIEPEPLTAEAWAPFGWIPVEDTDPADGRQRLTFEWGDPHVNVIGHRRDEVPAPVEGVLRCEMLYRHATHTQTLMVLDHPAVVAVAAPGTGFATPGDAEQIHVFALEALRPFVLHRSTWHWGPFPRQAEAVRLFNVQGLRYAEDNERVDLAPLGLAVDVVVA